MRSLLGSAPIDTHCGPVVTPKKGGIEGLLGPTTAAVHTIVELGVGSYGLAVDDHSVAALLLVGDLNGGLGAAGGILQDLGRAPGLAVPGIGVVKGVGVAHRQRHLVGAGPGGDAHLLWLMAVGAAKVVFAAQALPFQVVQVIGRCPPELYCPRSALRRR